jgi:hypothetical protein
MSFLTFLLGRSGVNTTEIMADTGMLHELVHLSLWGSTPGFDLSLGPDVAIARVKRDLDNYMPMVPGYMP